MSEPKILTPKDFTVSEWIEYCHRIMKRNGFWGSPHEPAVYIALMHSELSEALEALRNDDEDNFEEELADCVIRIFDFCGAAGIPLAQILQYKMEKNEERPFKHNKKF